MHSPLMRSIHPHNFITIASIGFEICSRQKSRINLKKGNNSKLRQAKVKVQCTALPLDEIYPPTKFHNHSLFSLRDMHRKKSGIKKKKTKGNNSKIKQARVTVHMHCTPP